MAGTKVVSKLDANSGFWQRKAGTAAVNLSIHFTRINNIIFKGHPYVISENIQAALMKNSKFETKLLHSHSSHVNNLLQIHLSLLNLTDDANFFMYMYQCLIDKIHSRFSTRKAQCFFWASM